MSTRYVYDIFSTTGSSNEQTQILTLEKTDEYPIIYAIPCNTYARSIAYNRRGQSVAFYEAPGAENGKILPVSGVNYVDYRKDTLSYKYVILAATAQDGVTVGECYLLEYVSGVSGSFWHILTCSPGGIAEITVISSNSSSNYGGSYKFPEGNWPPYYKRGGIIEKGNSSLGIQSSKTTLTTGAFPGPGDWRWRVYRGSDTIDPSGVTYSKEDIYPGDIIEIGVTPTEPTYGGTIYYQYQYTVDGNTWTNLGSKTTSTTATVTIPDGAKQFQVRVIASDGWGFTSTTYVYGSLLTTSQLKAYTSVNGNIRKLTKGWCIIGGVPKMLSKGYVTVDGIWKKLF